MPQGTKEAKKMINRIALLIALLTAPAFGQIKFSELPAKTASGSTAAQIFFPLVEMDGTPSTHRMSATELGNLVGASISDGDKGAIIVTSGVWGFDPAVVTSFSQSLLDNANASTWRSDLGLGTAATSASTAFATAVHAHAAEDITSGTMLTARLGTGTADAGKFLRGDSTWSNTLTGILLGGNTPGVNAPMINAAQIWSSGVTHYGFVLDVQDGGAATGSRTMQILKGGVEKWSLNVDGQQLNAGVYLASGGSFGWSSATPPTVATVDTLLYRDASSIIAQRSGNTPQTYRVYRRYTDASNYERGVIDFQTTNGTTETLQIGTQNAGTGAAKAVDFITGGTVRATIATDGVTTFSSNQIRVTTSKTPSSASDTGVVGTICWDSSYIYVCTATNTWKRVAIATW